MSRKVDKATGPGLSGSEACPNSGESLPESELVSYCSTWRIGTLMVLFVDNVRGASEGAASNRRPGST
eukprot:10044478-Karenia_brevis.AAC.1